MDFLPINFGRGFEEREVALAGVKRYISSAHPVMFYRTNDLIHSRRVLWHLEEALSRIVDVYGDTFNVSFARTLAVVHDDVELITGDVQLHDKERMTLSEIEALAQREHDAIPRLVERYAERVNGEDYATLLMAAKHKNCLESHFVSFFDKFDGAGEAWHEVFAGNPYFLLPAGGHNGYSGGYVRRLNEFPTKYPSMADFFNRFPHYLPTPFDFRATQELGRSHTETSLLIHSGYIPYERWKRTILDREGSALLVTQKEFLS